MLTGTVFSLNKGKTRSMGDDHDVLSAIFKHSIGEEPIWLSSSNLEGDEQADLVNHGGVDKAVCVYPYEHYTYWQERLDLSLPVGAFGENITMIGVKEADAHIGDTWKWGGAIVQISQPRRPCFKVAKRHGIKKFPLYIQETGYSGYYLRVLQEGEVSVNDPLVLIERKSDISVEFVNQVTYSRNKNLDAIEKLKQLTELSDAWKESL
ncbi:uncharacterized protein conserved in bacteria [Halalkalibacter wakoensis JCM 9140]|uniref:Uncharacterized protein conserved in bacteria n=1 Tax=Halalkalibacter wakoensis JCM 9140 TaxID=1236970 RepID=W4Q8J1_9BACI|nr:MOSC domain-containing protein [Halalkalibacter wakoensis]GAE28300.1 uncharacterized protein conserved in bacteria [Halalkalibacter wakoensis JCM 9140]